jgi:hypothetical protein
MNQKRRHCEAAKPTKQSRATRRIGGSVGLLRFARNDAIADSAP